MQQLILQDSTRLNLGERLIKREFLLLLLLLPLMSWDHAVPFLAPSVAPYVAELPLILLYFEHDLLLLFYDGGARVGRDDSSPF